MPAQRKSPERRQRKGQRKDQGADAGIVIALPVGDVVTPAPVKDWLAATKREWATYWTSDIAGIVAPSDHGSLYRMFELVDERRRVYPEYRRQTLVEGSQGQSVLNPLAGRVAQIDAELRQLGDRFGMNLKARLQMGVTFGEAHRSLEDVNRRIDARLDQAKTVEDPRRIAAEPGTKGL